MAAYVDVLPRHRADTLAVIVIFLVGSSQGSITAVNSGAHVPSVVGIVLAESVSVMGHSG